MRVYKVGGAVRDKLLGLPVKDQDWVVVGSTPEELSELGYKPVGKDFPVFLHPDSKEEYALARTERKTAPGYKGFAFNTSTEVTLEEDLIRRDLTINALAEDDQSNIVDCFNGQEDLKAGILRHISPAFIEDPLRVLRVARFAARFNFQVADETGKLMQTISDSGELDTLVAERVWTELERALNEKHPVRFFDVLRDCGALEKVFPEIDRLFGVPQPELHHPEIDSGIHTMMVLEQSCKLTEDPLIRFAVLAHDLGKGTTPKAQWPSHRGHEERSVKLIHILCDRYRIPGRYRELAVIVARHHLDCHRIKEM
ncbi:MAG TPA: multifunctional CCA addition/repair protein, partial [Dehalococcoidia bacterium]|nr:multifunctional CCA addition/repair protein [Dehalococcoidia bacterium]